jgi:hypothetical protein
MHELRGVFSASTFLRQKAKFFLTILRYRYLAFNHFITLSTVANRIRRFYLFICNLGHIFKRQSQLANR